MSILTGWREQYDRMLRSHMLLVRVAGGHDAASSDQARDALVHFFQDAYHLKDWIKNDPQVTTRDPEHLVDTSEPLRLCADLCNGTKHFRLTKKARTGDRTTAFTSQSVAVRPAAAGSGLPPDPARHCWVVSSCGLQYDAVALADDVVNDWDQWLHDERLHPLT
jgi:hypothetical protein